MNALAKPGDRTAELSRSERLHRGFRRLALTVSGAMVVAGFLLLTRAAFADDDVTRNAAFSGTMLLFSFAAIWAALCYAASWIARGFMRD